jgi:hypothetical protein
MSKTAFKYIDALKRFWCSDGRTDGQTDGLVIPIKGFHPLINRLAFITDGQHHAVWCSLGWFLVWCGHDLEGIRCGVVGCGHELQGVRWGVMWLRVVSIRFGVVCWGVFSKFTEG